MRHPRALKYLHRAASEDGAVAAIAEEAKRIRYPALPAAGLLAAEPFCVETFGRLGKGSLRLLRQAHGRMVEQHGPELHGWAGAAIFNRWLALLSCELQRALHDAALAMWGATGRCRAVWPEEGPLRSAALAFLGHAGQE